MTAATSPKECRRLAISNAGWMRLTAIYPTLTTSKALTDPGGGQDGSFEIRSPAMAGRHWVASLGLVERQFWELSPKRHHRLDLHQDTLRTSPPQMPALWKAVSRQRESSALLFINRLLPAPHVFMARSLSS